MDHGRLRWAKKTVQHLPSLPLSLFSLTRLQPLYLTHHSDRGSFSLKCISSFHIFFFSSKELKITRQEEALVCYLHVSLLQVALTTITVRLVNFSSEASYWSNMELCVPSWQIDKITKTRPRWWELLVFQTHIGHRQRLVMNFYESGRASDILKYKGLDVFDT